jgi:maltose/moltooligosaccharide transporter
VFPTRNEDGVPMHLILSFVIGAIILVGSILVSIFTTKEYSPDELLQFEDEMAHQETKIADANAKESSLLDILMISENAYHHAAIKLGTIFSWFGLLNVVFTTPAIAHHIYGLPISDSKSEAYQNAGDWVGVL